MKQPMQASANSTEYLQHPSNREQLAFDLRDGGYDVYDHQAGKDASVKPREQMKSAGWPYRRYKSTLQEQRDLVVGSGNTQPQAPAVEIPASDVSHDPFAQAAAAEEGHDFDSATEQHAGIVLGIGTCSYRTLDGTDNFVAIPGDDVRIRFPKAALPPEAISEFYTMVDIYESKMSEYDANFVFVPLQSLQRSRGLD